MKTTIGKQALHQLQCNIFHRGLSSTFLQVQTNVPSYFLSGLFFAAAHMGHDRIVYVRISSRARPFHVSTELSLTSERRIVTQSLQSLLSICFAMALSWIV